MTKKPTAGTVGDSRGGARVGFLGYGRMAQAISQGLDRSGLVPYAGQAAYDILTEKLEGLAGERGFKPAGSVGGLVGSAPLIIVAVKPHQVNRLLREAAAAATDQLFVSIAAGVTLSDLAEPLPKTVGLVRVIPNIPALVGQGMTLICAPEGGPPENLRRAREIFEAVGSVAVLDESLFNEGTAVSGSGPAYFFLFMEAMIRGAARLGLTWDLARELVLKTALGSAQTALANPGLSLADLRDQVASPGGTTAEGLLAMEEGALTAVVLHALQAASDKGRDLT
ncbi:MAG: pyrroline-5-carboxylate reductase [Deltaproteobacteria bacterium]|jgi:pyrroline-5-carboxylate reductase|nr:pyrroline-5-carboxylate reductase [Deltaproteobacteria bacterium]